MRLVRSWTFAMTVALVGGLALYVGWRIGGYAAGVLQNIGVALALFPLLVLAERTFEKLLTRTVEAVRADVDERVEEIRQEVAAALDQLSEATQARLHQARDADEQALQRFTDTPSVENLSDLFRRAANLTAISHRGPRVRIPGTDLRLHFRAVELHSGVPTSGVDTGQRALWVEVQEADGTTAWRMLWQTDEPAEMFATRLAEELSRRSQYPGDDVFDAAAMFRQLRDTLALGIRARTGAMHLDRQIGSVLEILPDGYVISDDGLFHISGDGRVGGFSINMLEASETPRPADKWPPELTEMWTLARALLLPSSRELKMRLPPR
jgi:hypothetical protein